MPEEPTTRPSMLATQPLGPKTRIRIGLFFTFTGLFVFILGADPGLFGLDRSPVTGFVQIAVFLFGLGMISIGGYLVLRTFWNGEPTTIRSDVGARLIATGYVVAVASGMADVFGFGSESFPNVPDFGVWQQRGVLMGEVLIGVGLFLLIRWKNLKK
ncbi:MAG TPA: hypothetical protein VMN57_14720 [Anaerolineales bacterium]|nr:hypothetical protein [Anaerolineales bacterium]